MHIHGPGGSRSSPQDALIPRLRGPIFTFSRLEKRINVSRLSPSAQRSLRSERDPRLIFLKPPFVRTQTSVLFLHGSVSGSNFAKLLPC